jgi:hypothetical protein
MPDINLHEGYSHDAASYDVDQLLVRFQRAKDRRSHWEGHWQECYEFALPQREGAIANRNPGEKKGTRLYDATASDAVDQLAASLLSELTPPKFGEMAKRAGFEINKPAYLDAFLPVAFVYPTGRRHFFSSRTFFG